MEFAHKKVSWTITMVLPDKCINVCMYVCLNQYIPNSLLKRYIYKWMPRCGRRLGWVRTLRTQTLLVVSSFSKELELFNTFQNNCFNAWRAQTLVVFSPFFNIFHIFFQYRQTLLVFSPLLKDFSSISIYTNPLGNLSFFNWNMRSVVESFKLVMVRKEWKNGE